MVVAEGASETGSGDQEGFVGILVSSLASDGAGLAQALGTDRWWTVAEPELVFRMAKDLAAAWARTRGRHRPTYVADSPKGMAKTARNALWAAALPGADYSAVMVLIDNDHAEKLDGSTKLSELDAGLACATLPHAKGVAVQTLEAWLLADTALLAQAAGFSLPADPEKLWGDRKDGDSNHPKCVFRRWMRAARTGPVDARERWSLIRAIPNAPSLRAFCREVVGLLRGLAPTEGSCE